MTMTETRERVERFGDRLAEPMAYCRLLRACEGDSRRAARLWCQGWRVDVRGIWRNDGRQG